MFDTVRQKQHILYSDEMVYNKILGKICNFECNYLRIYNNSSSGSRGNVVGMVTRLRTGRSGGSNYGRVKRFLSSLHLSRPAMEPTQPPVQWASLFFAGGKAAGA